MNLFEKTAQKYPGIVEKMCFAAILAGARIMGVYSEDDFGVEIKGDDSPITRADRIADNVIGNILKQNFPDIPIVSEESNCNLTSAVGEL